MILITKRNLFKLILRSVIFIVFIVFVINFPTKLIQFFNIQLFYFKIYHIVWFIFVLMLLKVLFVAPDNISSGKIYPVYFKLNKKLSSEQNKKILNKLSKKYNKRALNAAFFYLSIVIIYLVFYFSLNLNKLWVFCFVLFAILMDAVCITLWCPFRDWIVKNKCCNSCRIYNWGYWMIFIPLIIIPSFWTYSLIFLSILILTKWEYIHFKYPERFYEISNLNLICKNCKKASGFCRTRNKQIKK